jgi:hypothetical protein
MSPLNKKLLISDEAESVANMGFSLDGFDDVTRCSVEAKIFMLKNKKIRNFISEIISR